MSALTLPEPANWPAGRRRIAVLAVALSALFAVGVFFGGRYIILGQFLEAFVGLGILLPLALALFAVQRVSSGRTALRSSHDATGCLLKSDRTFEMLGLLSFAVVIPVGLVFITFTLIGDLEMFTSRRGQSIAVVAMCFAVLGSIAGLVSGWRRGGVGYVRLTPSGIDVADIFRTESVSWDDIDDVDDHSDVNKKTRKAVVLRRHDGSEKVIDGCDFYVPNGVGLYWMVRHYWRHPEDRAELTDGRSLSRLDEGRFDTDLA